MTLHAVQHRRRLPLLAKGKTSSAGLAERAVAAQTPLGVLQRRLQSLANASPQTAQLRLLDRAARGSASLAPVQRVSAVVQFERTVTNSQAANMRDTLVRMFGGKPSDWVIDKESGSTFNDNNGKDTTGHHNVRVTDQRDGSVWTCDFHNNGKYYTRGGAA